MPAVVLSGVLAILTAAGYAQVNETPPELKNIDVVEHLGATVPLNLIMKRSDGQDVTLNDYLGRKKPILFNLVYYQCPMLCTLVLNGVLDAMKTSGLILGKDYEAVTLSIDPTETPELAADKKEAYLKELGTELIDAETAKRSWHFHTAEAPVIQSLADSLGFKFEKDAAGEYAHAAVTFVLTPEGRISRYLYGVQYKPKDVRLALVEAGKDHIGTSLDKLLLYCYSYDASAKGYVVMASRVMTLGGAVFVLALLISLSVLWVQDRRRKDKMKFSEAA